MTDSNECFPIGAIQIYFNSYAMVNIGKNIRTQTAWTNPRVLLFVCGF